MYTARKCALAALSLGVGACAAQATEDYKGEPLLSLRGQATVNTLTGGLPIQPALCFIDDLPTYEVVRREELPPQVADIISTVQFWPPYRRAVVDLESEGRFPAEFNVSLYLPPPSSVIQPYFVGDLELQLYHAWQWSRLSFEVGLGAGASLFHQRFASMGNAPARLSAVPFISPGLGAQLDLSGGFYADVHLGAETHFLRLRGSRRDAALDVSFAMRSMIGLGKYF